MRTGILATAMLYTQTTGAVGFALEGKVSAQVAIFAGIALIFLGALSRRGIEEASDAE